MQGMFNTFYDISKSALVGDKPLEGATYPPRLLVSLRDGNPHFQVYTGIKGVTIRFPCELFTITTIMDQLEVLANKGENGSSFTVTSERPVWKNGTPTDEKYVVNVLRVGKSKSGILYLMIEEEGKPKVPFALHPTKFHEFKNTDGAPYPEDLISRQFAKSYAYVIKSMVSTIGVDYQRDRFTHDKYKPTVIEPFDPNKGKASTGMTGSSGVPAPNDPMIFDEDIPM